MVCQCRNVPIRQFKHLPVSVGILFLTWDPCYHPGKGNVSSWWSSTWHICTHLDLVTVHFVHVAVCDLRAEDKVVAYIRAHRVVSCMAHVDMCVWQCVALATARSVLHSCQLVTGDGRWIGPTWDSFWSWLDQAVLVECKYGLCPWMQSDYAHRGAPSVASTSPEAEVPMLLNL